MQHDIPLEEMVREGSMTKSPFEMTPEELKAWKQELKVRACLNFIGEIYYAAIFERNAADFFCIAGATEKKSNKVAAKNRHKKLGE